MMQKPLNIVINNDINTDSINNKNIGSTIYHNDYSKINTISFERSLLKLQRNYKLKSKNIKKLEQNYDQSNA
jgi:hypothetical protein